jgi:hypothetical protein
MPISIIQEYAATLSGLTGTDFQAEVCARLQSVILGFQTIPAKPHGDAGLDGFSHNGKHGYCCYGLEYDSSKTNKDRERAIVDKFRGDLRRLFELSSNGSKLVCIESPEMATILPDGQRLEHIELVVNWFESHRVLNPIGTAVASYKTKSKCRYVHPSAVVVVVGPKDLANRYAVDEITIVRARQRAFIQRVQQVAEVLTINDPRDFETKMAALQEIRPDQLRAIQSLGEQFRANWRMALAFEQELHDTLPNMHRALEEGRRRILTQVSQLMLASNEPWTKLMQAGTIAEEILRPDFGKLYGSLVQDVSSGEIARLIGECPVGWEKARVADG